MSENDELMKQIAEEQEKIKQEILKKKLPVSKKKPSSLKVAVLARKRRQDIFKNHKFCRKKSIALKEKAKNSK